MLFSQDKNSFGFYKLPSYNLHKNRNTAHFQKESIRVSNGKNWNLLAYRLFHEILESCWDNTGVARYGGPLKSKIILSKFMLQSTIAKWVLSSKHIKFTRAGILVNKKRCDTFSAFIAACSASRLRRQKNNYTLWIDEEIIGGKAEKENVDINYLVLY